MNITEKLLQELKNTSISYRKKGTAAEALVALHFFDQGWQLIRYQHKTPFAEIDLVFRDVRHQYMMVEVKLCASDVERERSVAIRQLRRLLRAQQYLESSLGGIVEFVAAFVDHSGGIQVIENFFDEVPFQNYEAFV